MGFNRFYLLCRLSFIKGSNALVLKDRSYVLGAILDLDVLDETAPGGQS